MKQTNHITSETMKTNRIRKEIELRYEDDLSMIELFHDGNEIGWAAFEVINDEYIYPESVEIDPSHRGLGLYKDVIDFVIKNMEEMTGVNEFRSVQRTEAANKFYQKFTSVSDYDEVEHKNGNQEQIIITSNFEISYK